MHDQTNRRTKTRHTGVYFKDTANGRSYSIAYPADGRLVWETIPGNERAAVTARADRVTKMGRGVQVAPSRELFAPFAATWLDSQRAGLGERTIDQYDRAIRLHLTPAFGHLRLHQITTDRVAAWIATMTAAGKSGWSRPGRVGAAWQDHEHGGSARQNRVQPNRPVGPQRTPAAWPRWTPTRPGLGRNHAAVGQRDDAPKPGDPRDRDFHRVAPIRTVGVGVVRRRLRGRGGARARPVVAPHHDPQNVEVRCGTARRRPVAVVGRGVEVPPVGQQVSQDTDYVFAAMGGRPLVWSNVDRRCLHKAVAAAGLAHVKFHDLRHTFASLLIAQGADVVFVAAQLGHADPTVTLRVYAHLWQSVAHAARHRDLLDATLSAAVSANTRLTPDAVDGRTTKHDLA